MHKLIFTVNKYILTKKKEYPQAETNLFGAYYVMRFEKRAPYLPIRVIKDLVILLPMKNGVSNNVIPLN